jgi:predicted CoA-binding protein
VTIGDDATLRRLLCPAGVIALVGASQKPWRDSNSIMAYLLNAGYTVLPVNPSYESVLGQKCYPGLRELPVPVDIVNIFRNPDKLLPIITDAVALMPKAVWLRSGVVNHEAERLASAAGISVVMDRCIAVDHRRLCNAQ